MSFGKNLQRLRKAAGLSQSALATASGQSVRSIQNWEIDRNLPRIDTAAKIAHALGVTVDELMTAAEPKPQGRPAKGKGVESAPAKKGRRRNGG